MQSQKNSSSAIYKGTFSALITPFNDVGRIDYETFEKIILWHLESEINGFVICGTTGEYPTLMDDEKIELIQFVKKIIPQDFPLIVGAGSNSTQKTCQQIEEIKQLGVTAALIAFPYYNLPNFQGCYEHFQYLNDLDFPLIAYHHPKRTGICLTTDELKTILQLPNVVALKESHPDPDRILELNGFSVFCGDDAKNILFIQNGAKGVISAFANVIPKEMTKLVSLCLSQDGFSAKRLYDKYKNLFDAVFSEVNPQGIKFALSQMGKCKPFLRLPLVQPSLENQKRIITQLNELQLTLESVR